MNKIKDSDVVLAIVDKKFIGNTMLYMELEFALIWGKETRKPILLPIILDGAIVPTALERMMYVKCDSKSEEDVRKAKLNIKKVLEHKKNYAHKNTKENYSRTSSMIIIERCFQLLKPNGRLGLVLPESVFNAVDNMQVGLFLYRMFKINAIVSLPRNVFIDTPTLTSLLFAQKKTAQEIEK